MTIPTGAKPSFHHPDDLIVNYHDACIYARDLALVESPTAWLNDACIHFYTTFLQQLQKKRFPDHNKIRFLDPAVISFLMHQCQDEDELREFASGSSCENFEGAQTTEGLCLLVPINDQFMASHDTWAVPSAGMHWSLLVVCYHGSAESNLVVDGSNNSRISTVACHLDSAGGNYAAAKRVAQKIQTTLNLVVLANNTSGCSTERNVPVMECKVPRQQNGYDCGVHVLAAAEAILFLAASSERTILLSPAELEQAVQAAINLNERPDFCVSFRRKVADCIRQVAGTSSH
ncbi:hypothetical protein ACA910_018210 [Epithemia clementina (nom. ined.)]